MGCPKVIGGVRLSIKLPSDDLKRLKIEAIERGTLESSIVLEALRLHWEARTHEGGHPIRSNGTENPTRPLRG